MQVGNIYVDVEIPALNLKNFLKVEDCYLLRIIESAGASLPFAVMIIKTSNEKVKNGINENNKIILKIGNSPADVDSFDVYPVIVQPNKGPQGDCWIVEFGGFIGDKSYIVDHSSKSYYGNSLEVLKYHLKGTGLKLKSEVTNVFDNQVVWRRINKSSAAFAMDVVLHLNIAPSFPLCGVDKHLNFILKDFNKLCKQEPKYYFTPAKPSEKNQIQYFNNFNIESFKNSFNIF